MLILYRRIFFCIIIFMFFFINVLTFISRGAKAQYVGGDPARAHEGVCEYMICIKQYDREYRPFQHLLSERLASLGIRGAQLRAPLKPPVHQTDVRGVSGGPSIRPP